MCSAVGLAGSIEAERVTNILPQGSLLFLGDPGYSLGILIIP